MLFRSNCRPESVYDDFLQTKLLYHKEDGRMFYHMVQSFPKGEPADPTAAHAAALKLAEYFEGREVLVCTHTDRDHIHSHFIINSVSLDDGRKLHISEKELSELRQRNMRQTAPPPEWRLTEEEWGNLLDWIINLHQLIKEQNSLLAQLKPPAQPPQLKTLAQDVAAIRDLLQQAGRKKERRFSLPHISLPRPSWAWLMVPAVLVGLAVLWYSSVTILKALGM